MVTSTKKTVFALVLFLTLSWLICMLVVTSRSSHKHLISTFASSSYFKTVYPRRNFENSTWKNILLWTDYFGSKNWEFQERHLRGCGKRRCRVTSDHSQLPHSHAVLFNSRSLNLRTVLPQSRTPDQVWVLHNSEPPYYIFLDWNHYAGVFNWTSWFRLDADVYSPYGNFTKRPKGVKPRLRNFFANKTNLSYWAASSCTDPGQRYRLISELKKNLDIHTYGNCGTFICKKSSPRCSTVFRGYKFAFALENGPCRDYITEKFWGALHREQIPVVRGGANYRLLVPPHSYIDVADFSNTSALAAYIRRVGHDERLYNSYFRWRRDYVLSEDQVVNWCALCTALHDPHKPAQSYTDLRGWAAEDNCHLYSTWRQLMDYLARFLFLVGF